MQISPAWFSFAFELRDLDSDVKWVWGRQHFTTAADTLQWHPLWEHIRTIINATLVYLCDLNNILNSVDMTLINIPPAALTLLIGHTKWWAGLLYDTQRLPPPPAVLVSPPPPPPIPPPPSPILLPLRWSCFVSCLWPPHELQEQIFPRLASQRYGGRLSPRNSVKDP